MEPGFLSRHPLNQLLDPIKDWLIREPGGQKTMLDLPVDFDARVTPRGGCGGHWEKSPGNFGVAMPQIERHCVAMSGIEPTQ
jgi:hypothetical protein